MAGIILTPISKTERLSLFAERESIDADKHLILRLQLVPAKGLTLEDAALRVLLVLCARTMAVLPYESVEQRLLSSGRIISLEERTGVTELAIPLELVRPSEGLAHLYSFISTPAEYSYCDEYWVENVEFPRSFVSFFNGPRFGTSGVRNVFGLTRNDRPLLGVIAKPRTGAPIASIAETIAAALRGGCDFVCDDLLMVSPSQDLDFDTRIKVFVKTTRDLTVEREGKKSYIVNVSTNPIAAIRLAESAMQAGVDALLVNGFGMGFGGLAEFVDHFKGQVPIITSNLGAGILTRPKLMGHAGGRQTGISETVISKLSRLSGADAVHAGTAASECYGETAWGPATRALRQPFYNLKTCMAVAEGDLNVANLWENIRSLGRDVLLEPTSGILAAPGGPVLAAKAFRALAERLFPEMTDEEAHQATMKLAKEQKHVKELLEFYGYKAG